MARHRTEAPWRGATARRGPWLAITASLLVAAGPLGVEPAQPADEGRIAGRVTTALTPALAPLRVTTDYDICGREVPNEALVVDSSGGVANAAVTLAGVPARPSDATPVVTNEGCRFEPRVVVAQAGGPVAITSADDTLHTTHAYADDGRSLFNVAIPMAGLTITRPILADGVVRLACDTHTWMRGYILAALDRTVVTAPDGSFEIADVPPGTYRLHVWHEHLTAPAQSVTVAAGATTSASFVLTGAIPEG